MAIIYLKKLSNGCLVPSLDQDAEKLKPWKIGEILRAEIKKQRNGKFHRKLFALLNLAFENQEKYKTFEDFFVEIKLKTGHYREHVTTKGKMIYIPKSISYSNMDELEFTVFYKKVINVIVENFMIGSTEEEIEKEVSLILSFA